MFLFIQWIFIFGCDKSLTHQNTATSMKPKTTKNKNTSMRSFFFARARSIAFLFASISFIFVSQLDKFPPSHTERMCIVSKIKMNIEFVSVYVCGDWWMKKEQKSHAIHSQKGKKTGNQLQCDWILLNYRFMCRCVSVSLFANSFFGFPFILFHFLVNFSVIFS